MIQCKTVIVVERGRVCKSPGKQEDRVQEVKEERVGSRVLRGLEVEEKYKMVILTIAKCICT